jgi:hypothetical protein
MKMELWRWNLPDNERGNVKRPILSPEVQGLLSNFHLNGDVLDISRSINVAGTITGTTITGTTFSGTLPWDDVDKTGSDLADLATKSHTSLTDIGTNTHGQIDSHIGDASDPHGATLTQTTANITTLQLGGVAVTSTAAELNITDGLGDAWTSFDPTMTGLTIGAGTKTGFYKQIGKTVFFRVHIVFAADTVGGKLTLVLPVAINAGYSNFYDSIGTCIFYDSSTAVIIGGRIESNGGLYSMGAAATYVNLATISATIPFTWAANDQIGIQGFYETT